MTLWRQFEGQQGGDPLQVAQVVAQNADGTSTVQFPNGSQLKVRGQDVPVSSYAFIRAGEIRGQAPAVVPVTLEV